MRRQKNKQNFSNMRDFTVSNMWDYTASQVADLVEHNLLYNDPTPSTSRYNDPRPSMSYYSKPRPNTSQYNDPRSNRGHFNDPRSSWSHFNDPNSNTSQYNDQTGTPPWQMQNLTLRQMSRVSEETNASPIFCRKMPTVYRIPEMNTGTNNSNTMTASHVRSSTAKTRTFPTRGKPGGVDDPLRRGLSGSGIRWYLRYLGQGLEPVEARTKAEEHKAANRSNIVSQRRTEFPSTAVRIEANKAKRARRALLEAEEASRKSAPETTTDDKSNKNKNRVLKYPELGMPGGRDDPLRKGLSGCGVKWYLRFLQQGLEPQEARKKAVEHKMNSGLPQSSEHRGEISDTTAPAVAEAAEPNPSTSPEAPKKLLRIAVLPKQYPVQLLSSSDLTILEDAILAEVAKGWHSKLKFIGVHFKPGMLFIDCETPETAEWLQQTAPKLENWSGVELMACPREKIPVAQIVNLCFPRSAGQEQSKTFSLIEAQNEGLSTKLWTVMSSRDEGRNQLLTVLIDVQSIATLKANDNTLSYRFGKVQVRGAKPHRKIQPIPREDNKDPVEVVSEYCGDAGDSAAAPDADEMMFEVPVLEEHRSTNSTPTGMQLQE